MKQQILVVTDNRYLYRAFRNIVGHGDFDAHDFTYCFSPNNEEFQRSEGFKPLDVKTECETIKASFDLVLSLHCKQFFPADLVNAVRCVNVHPGFNPYNRGWFPQVFSIINKKPLGVTIHEMDAELDHGPVIDRVEVPLYVWDTSWSAYRRVLDAEAGLLEKRLNDIVNRNYQAVPINEEGNVNYKRDFDALCRLNLGEEMTLGAAIDRLRATTHGDYRNSYFLDEDGRKVYVRIVLEKEEVD